MGFTVYVLVSNDVIIFFITFTIPGYSGTYAFTANFHA